MTEGVQSLHGCSDCTVQSDAQGGAVTSTQGVQGTAPEPSLTIPQPSLKKEAKQSKTSGAEVHFDPSNLVSLKHVNPRRKVAS